MKALFIDGARSGYAPDQCGSTLTVNELIELLEQYKEWCGAGDLPIYLYNDNGYTYGEVTKDTITIGNYVDGEGVAFDIEEQIW